MNLTSAASLNPEDNSYARQLLYNQIETLEFKRVFWTRTESDGWSSLAETESFEVLDDTELESMSFKDLKLYQHSFTGHVTALEAIVNAREERKSLIDEINEVSDHLKGLARDFASLTPATYDTAREIAFLLHAKNDGFQFRFMHEPDIEGLISVNAFINDLNAATLTPSFQKLICQALVREALGLKPTRKVELPLDGLSDVLKTEIEKLAEIRVIVSLNYCPSAPDRYASLVRGPAGILCEIPLAALKLKPWSAKAGMIAVSDYTPAELEIITTLFGDDAYSTLEQAALAAQALEGQG